MGIDRLEDKKGRDKDEAEKIGKGVELNPEFIGETEFTGDFTVDDVKRSPHPCEDNGDHKMILCDEVSCE